MKGSIQDFKIVHEKDILVRADYKKALETSSGILITVNPSVTGDRPTNGEVLQIGSEVTEIKVGDNVFFDKVNGHDIYLDDNPDEWFVLLDSEVILGKLE